MRAPNARIAVSISVILLLFLSISTRIRPCHSFPLHSTSVVRPTSRSIQADNKDTETTADERNSMQEQYLKFHQTVGKRKTLRRLMEIASVLSGKVLRPLVCSLVRDPHPIRSSSEWDEFWLRQSRSLSNAERVAKGLPPLGPTFVKLGQALATRPDILHYPLAEALANLQDRVAPFDNFNAKRIIRRELKLIMKKNQEWQKEEMHQKRQYFIKNDNDLKAFLDNLSDEPVAAASIAQIYRGELPGYGSVAVKVQRPGIRKTVEKDATLLHTVATWLERLEWPKWSPIVSSRGEPMFGSAQFVKTVDEVSYIFEHYLLYSLLLSSSPTTHIFLAFMHCHYYWYKFTARVLEEMDFKREADNMRLFADMYCHRRGKSQDVQVVVPQLIPELSSRRVIVMEWLEGQKLTDICIGCDDKQSEVDENLSLVRNAIEVSLSQLLTTGIVHADPHTGNLLKVRTSSGNRLGYLDFGLVNAVPERFQDGIVCATCQLVFARNIEAVAELCVDLGLLPEDKLKDTNERERFINALEQAVDDVLVWPKDKRGRSTEVPRIRFERALPSLSKLIKSFEFTVPPYFLNNARAIATLEGIALKLDPNFNILHVIYPYSINHLMRNPRVSKKSEETFLEICRSPKTKLFDHNRFMMLLTDWSLLTGYKKRKIYWDLITSVGTRHVMSRIFRESIMKRIRLIKKLHHKHFLAYWEQGWLNQHVGGGYACT